LKTLGLISCTKKKQNYPCKASEIYSASDLFSKAYAYCEKNYDQIAILSAKYGLVFPNDVIEPYDLTLNKMSTEEVKVWSERVFKQAQDRIDLSGIGAVFFHAGNKYRKYLIPKLQSLGIGCEAPLGNLGIGKQLRWYKEHDC
jgi:cytoplasmic iron level regulating protein YaaA (DUF328/UPF0246 family)